MKSFLHQISKISLKFAQFFKIIEYQAIFTKLISSISICFYRNLRGEKQVLRNRKLSSQHPVPPHYLRQRLSSPVLTYQRKTSPPSTPDKEVRLRSLSTSQVQNSRLALPSRVPPLGGARRVLTPELRSVTTPDKLVKENIQFGPEIVDIGTYDRHLYSFNEVICFYMGSRSSLQVILVAFCFRYVLDICH